MSYLLWLCVIFFVKNEISLKFEKKESTGVDYAEGSVFRAQTLPIMQRPILGGQLAAADLAKGQFVQLMFSLSATSYHLKKIYCQHTTLASSQKHKSKKIKTTAKKKKKKKKKKDVDRSGYI